MALLIISFELGAPWKTYWDVKSLWFKKVGELLILWIRYVTRYESGQFLNYTEALWYINNFSNKRRHRYYNLRVINVTPLASITQSRYAQTSNVSLVMSVPLHETKNIENADTGEVPLDQNSWRSQ